jgi:peptide/nickel transport system permease protein
MKYIARRLLHGMILLFGISLMSFLFSDLAPGDILSDVQLDPRVSHETLTGLRSRFGLDRPLPVRYADWVASVLKGDFGYSLAYRAPVGPLLAQRIPCTLLLTGIATLLVWALAIPLGIWSATQGRISSAILNLVLSSFLAIPELLLALTLLVWAVRTGHFPAGGMRSPGFDSMTAGERFRDVAWHLVLPVTTLVLGMLPVLVRHVRASMVESLASGFVLNARALGIPRRRILFRHALPAALNPMISLAGFSFGALLSGSLLIEVVVGWPGLGPLFLDAVTARDFDVVIGVVMLAGTLFVTGNLLADIALYRTDPRIREFP